MMKTDNVFHMAVDIWRQEHNMKTPGFFFQNLLQRTYHN